MIDRSRTSSFLSSWSALSPSRSSMKVRPPGDGLGVKGPKTTEGEAGPATLFQFGGAVLGHRTVLPPQDGAQATTDPYCACRFSH